VGGFGGGHFAGHVGGFRGGHVAGVARGRFGRDGYRGRRFVGGDWNYGLGCPYNYTPYVLPYACTY
jgi:hypothetical protein